MSASRSPSANAVMQCMEIRGGNEAVEARVASPGLDIWVSSEPHLGAANGGDVHYISLCGGGMITRLIVADVSGHGADVAGVALGLRRLMRRHINSKRQERLVRGLNRQFTRLAAQRHFATAVVATYSAATGKLAICNAGHPRPLLRRRQSEEWTPLTGPVETTSDRPGNLPLGFDADITYSQFTIDLREGDLVLFFTDALIEARSAAGEPLGEEGLLRLMRTAAGADPDGIPEALLRALSAIRRGEPADDDQTFVLLACNGKGPSPPSTLRQRIDVFARFFGLRSV